MTSAQPTPAPIVLTISDEGTIRFLVSEDTRPFIDDSAMVRRASHVQPDNLALRWVFHTLRAMFGEYGWMAAFTRRWPCLWMVDTSPVGGPILPGRYRARSAAISAEIEYLQNNFL